MGSQSKFADLVTKTGFQQLVMKGHRHQFAAGDEIIKEGDEIDSLYWVSVGAVRINLVAGDGRDTFVARLEPGDFFGESSLMPNLKLRSLSAAAVRDSLILEVPKADFIEISSRYPEVWLELIEQQAERMAMVTQRLQETQLLSVQSRLLRALNGNVMKSTSQMTPEGTVLRIGRQDLADIVGCTREMVSKALQKLSDEGDIILKGRAIVIPHPHFGKT